MKNVLDYYVGESESVLEWELVEISRSVRLEQTTFRYLDPHNDRMFLLYYKNSVDFFNASSRLSGASCNRDVLGVYHT